MRRKRGERDGEEEHDMIARGPRPSTQHAGVLRCTVSLYQIGHTQRSMHNKRLVRWFFGHMTTHSFCPFCPKEGREKAEQYVRGSEKIRMHARHWLNNHSMKNLDRVFVYERTECGRSEVNTHTGLTHTRS